MAQYRYERNFLKCLCKGHIQDLIEDVGWNQIQCAIVRKRYLEFKSTPRICLELNLSTTAYNRHFIEICKKLQSYFILHKDSAIAELYKKNL